MKKKGVGEGNNDGGGVALNGKKKKDKKDSDCCKWYMTYYGLIFSLFKWLLVY